MKLVDHPDYGDFVSSFVDEHLVEIGFLLSQRAEIRKSDKHPWTTSEVPESRCFAHLRALAAWGTKAREAALEALGDEDPYLVRAGAFASAVTVGTQWGALRERLLKAESHKLEALEDGLRHAPAKDLGPCLSPLLEEKRPELIAFALRVLGARQEGSPSAIRALIDHPDPIVRESAAWALARRGSQDEGRMLETLITTEPEAAASLLLPLALMSPGRAADLVRRALRSELPAAPGMALVLALTGDAKDAALLATNLVRETVEPQAAVAEALGILGGPLGIPALLDALEDHDEARSAPMLAALARISGQPPEPGRAAWERWWSLARTRFSDDERYRNGAAVDARAVIGEIEAPMTKLPDRRRAGLEMISRHRAPEGFEVDAFVGVQRRAIARWNAQVKARG